MKTKIPITWIVLLGLMLGLTVAALSEPKTQTNTFVFGSAHEHASLTIKIHGDPFDFSQEQFQLQSPFIHLENNNGYVIHRHSQGITLGDLFKTLNLGLTPDCFTFDDGKEFCTNDDYTLKFYINGKKVQDLRDYLIFDGDLILISYGSENQEVIAQQLGELKSRGFPFELRQNNDNNYLNV